MERENMDRDERMRMFDDKKAFVAALSIVLREQGGDRIDVENITLEVEKARQHPEAYMERIRIKFKSGGQLPIPAEGNSNLANMLAIGRALL